MRKAALAAALGLLLCGCSREFQVSGTVTVASSLQGKTPKVNSVLFIIAKNPGGVPIAVRRIVNPQFPLDYALGVEDLIVPNVYPKDGLWLEVEMNAHGRVGKPVKGDVVGRCPDPVHSGQRNVHIVIDRQV